MKDKKIAIEISSKELRMLTIGMSHYQGFALLQVERGKEDWKDLYEAQVGLTKKLNMIEG